MPIDLSAPPVPFSFEVYPPRSDARRPPSTRRSATWRPPGPRFISVTYGAGGSTRRPLARVLRFIRRETAVVAARAPDLRRQHLRRRERAHPGVPGCRHHELPRTARRPARRHHRGRPLPRRSRERGPAGAAHRSRAGRARALHRGGRPRLPGAASVERRRKVDIAVAAFPNGHPRSRHPGEHIDALLAKQAAGATLAITQVFFYADDYLGFVQRSREAGVTIPILPGHHADHLAVAPAPRARAQRREAARRARDRPRDRADAPRGSTHVGIAQPRRSPARSSTAAPPASISTPSTTTRPCSPSSATPDPHPPHPEGAHTMTEPRPAFPAGTILGYPRIGRRRELKRAVEAHWAGAHRRGDARGAPRRSCAARRASGSPRSASAAPTRRSPSPSRTTTRCSTPRSPSARFRRASRPARRRTADRARAPTSPRRAATARARRSR